MGDSTISRGKFTKSENGTHFIKTSSYHSVMTPRTENDAISKETIVL